MELLLPVWKAYSKYFTGGVWISNGLAHCKSDIILQDFLLF